MQRVKTESGVDLIVDVDEGENALTLRLFPLQPTDAVLHWGAVRAWEPRWYQPEREGWPAGSEPFGAHAVRTPLHGRNQQDPAVIRIDASERLLAVELVLHHFHDDCWDDRRGRNYRVDLPRPAAERRLLEHARSLADQPGASELVEPVEDNARIAVVAARRGAGMVMAAVTDLPGEVLLHWGVARDRRRRWTAPPPPMQPEGTETLGDVAARTPFRRHAGVQAVSIDVDDVDEVNGIRFVLYEPAVNRWIRRGGTDFFVPVPGAPGSTLPRGLEELADTIVDRELNERNWSQVHRLDLAHDLIERLALGEVDAMATIFVWLRYAALGQLDSQRNCQPDARELIHATDRLTRLLAFRYERDVRARKVIRWVIGTLARGGDGQRVRDTIVQLMHRHGIEEARGDFLEQWHQKLHNDPSPEDVVICEAFSSFLGRGGDLEAFHETLRRGGVSRERLSGFERPIRSDPKPVEGPRDELVRDFDHLRTLIASMHDGADLELALRGADRALDPDVREQAWWIHERRRDEDTYGLTQAVTRVREWVCARRQGDRDDARDLLALDVALEEFLGGALQRSEQVRKDERAAVSMIPLALRNLSLSVGGDADLQACVRQWERLAVAAPADELWALRASAAVDRVARVLSANVDAMRELVESKAAYLGRALEAEPWTVRPFGEHVVRGRLEFAVSRVLRRLDAALAKRASRPPYRVVSRGAGAARGRVVVTPDLGTLRGQVLREPVIVVADHVAGDEALPPLVTAVLTRAAVDLVSHAAVRARDTGLMVVTVQDDARYAEVRAWTGTTVGLRVTPADQVVRDDEVTTEVVRSRSEERRRGASKRAAFESYAIPLPEVRPWSAGGKSNRLRQLRGKLPDWIRTPRSMVVPFAVFDFVLQHPSNQALRSRHGRLIERLADVSDPHVPAAAREVREGIVALAQPEAMREALRRAAHACELSWPPDEFSAWRCITEVWASKYGDRAVLHRRACGMLDEDVQMGVLVQEVSHAPYAFALHTVHPTLGDVRRGYGEVVVGLGEALVGNHPGWPLGFTWEKDSGHVTLATMSSKRVALSGSGLIFRSDASGEDEAVGGGAGLYESAMLPAPNQDVIDYASEPLVWDDAYRQGLLAMLGRVGVLVEDAMGGAQDVEGTCRQGECVVVQTRPQAGLGA